MITMPTWAWILIAVIWIIGIRALLPRRKMDKQTSEIYYLISTGTPVSPELMNLLKDEDDGLAPKFRKPFIRRIGECPRCGTRSKEILVCPMCGDPGCVEQCIPGGKDTTCTRCDSEKADFESM